MTHEKLIEAYDNQSKVEELKHEQEVLFRIIKDSNPIDCAYHLLQREAVTPLYYDTGWIKNFNDMIRDCAGKRGEMIQSEIDQLEKEFETI